MKKLLALLLLFGIVGFSVPTKSADRSDSDSADWKSSNSKIMGINYRYKIDAINHSVTIKASRKIRTKRPAELNEAWREICFSEFNSFTKEFIPSPKKKRNGFHEWSNPFTLKCHDPVAFKKKKLMDEKKGLEAQKKSDDIRNENIKRVALNKAKILEERKSKCREYGFKDNTDGMGMCLIELDKLDAIKKQVSSANLAQSNLIAEQQAEAKKQRQAQALINLGAYLSKTPTMTQGSAIAVPKRNPPSYSDSYTYTSTVQSNQNCPSMNVPLKKQEVKRGNRICYY